MTDTKPHMQGAQKASSNYPEKSTPRHIIFKLQNTKGKVLEEIRGETMLIQRGTRMRITADFSSCEKGETALKYSVLEKKTLEFYMTQIIPQK